VLETVLQAHSDEDSDSADAQDSTTGDENTIPRRLQELLEILDHQPALHALHQAAQALWGRPDGTWELWLRDRFCSTLASAILHAAQNLCPQMDRGALLIDLGSGPAQYSDDFGIAGAELWLTESTIGGGGFVEEFLARYAEDPRRFFRLLDDALAPSDLELVGFDLERLLEVATSGRAEDAPVAAAFAAVRAADSHQASTLALQALRVELAHRGICPTPTLLVAVNARLLRPGTNFHADTFLATVIRDWMAAEQRLGIDIDARVLAFAQCSNPHLERALGLSAPGGSDQARSAWRYGVLYGMLWPRGAQVRAEALRHQSSFSVLPDCDRLLVLAAISRPVRTVTLANDTWFAELSRILVEDGRADLVCANSETERFADALLRIGSEPVDSDALLIHATLAGVHRDGTAIRAAFELPEAFQ
jgi:hypothetical protein